MSGQRPAGRAKSESQPDLFAERGLTDARGVEMPPVPDTPLVPADLTDEALIALLPQASMLAAQGLCSEAASRGLVEAVPALEQLWRRFAGFGIATPLVEQRAVLNALARLDCAAARTALRGIVLSKGLPASLLPAALGAAAEAALSLPAGFVGPLLEHEDASVRAAAFALAPRAGVPVELLRDGLGCRRPPCGGWRRSPWATPGTPERRFLWLPNSRATRRLRRSKRWLRSETKTPSFISAGARSAIRQCASASSPAPWCRASGVMGYVTLRWLAGLRNTPDSDASRA